ncbi:MAG: lipoate--protein ligase family protein [Verrucomicrobiota bacterium]
MNKIQWPSGEAFAIFLPLIISKQQSGKLQMILASLPCSTPAEHLALDEALLDFGEAHPGHPGFMRFWEPTIPFVALGYSKVLRKEVHEDFCAAKQIPILRRCSGGGTVLQAPGCLNYALVLPIDSRPELGSINSTNCFIMKEQAAALRRIPLAKGMKIEVHGYSDLTLRIADEPQARKFSGNSQRRKRRYLLFHGSFLLNTGLDLIEQALRAPEQQPEYREQRSHHDFLVNLPMDADSVRDALISHWCPDAIRLEEAGDYEATLNEITARVKTLVQEKYGQEDWNYRF